LRPPALTQNSITAKAKAKQQNTATIVTAMKHLTHLCQSGSNNQLGNPSAQSCHRQQRRSTNRPGRVRKRMPWPQVRSNHPNMTEDRRSVWDSKSRPGIPLELRSNFH